MKNTILKLLLGLTAASLPLLAQTESKAPKVTSLQCLTANIFFEARGESEQGMKAVAKVTTNRVKSKKYPDSVCGVVFQRKQFSWSHQQKFSTIEKVLKGSVSDFKPRDRVAYQQAEKIAQKALKMRLNTIPDSALWYHAVYVKPKWSKSMKKVAHIGQHIFYSKG